MLRGFISEKQGNGLMFPENFALRKGVAVVFFLQNFTRSRAMKDSIKAFHELPLSRGCRLVDFEQTGIVTLWEDVHVLIITGKVFASGVVEVKLVPYQYVEQPEYWEIEVVGGCSSRVKDALPGLSPEPMWTTAINLKGIMGTLGVEVIGASKREKISFENFLEVR
ncbi:MAG: hypothetical protein WBM35_16635 [Candidatus Electrothrix sp.]